MGYTEIPGGSAGGTGADDAWGEGIVYHPAPFYTGLGAPDGGASLARVPAPVNRGIGWERGAL